MKIGLSEKLALERLLSRVEIAPGTGCWLWTGSTNGKSGYGQMNVGIFTPAGHARPELTHRLAFFLMRGPVPDGMVVDHLCQRFENARDDYQRCINPLHLNIDTYKGNLDKRIHPSSADLNQAKTHCPSGHSYSGSNLYLPPKGGRICRECTDACRKAYEVKLAGGHIATPRPNARKSHCKRGHPLEGDNLDSLRRCRECQRIRGRIYNTKRRANGRKR